MLSFQDSVSLRGCASVRLVSPCASGATVPSFFNLPSASDGGYECLSRVLRRHSVTHGRLSNLSSLLANNIAVGMIYWSAILFHFLLSATNMVETGVRAACESAHERRTDALHDGLPQGGCRGRGSFYVDLEESMNTASTVSHSLKERVSG